jgi:urease gamma subunit
MRDKRKEEAGSSGLTEPPKDKQRANNNSAATARPRTVRGTVMNATEAGSKDGDQKAKGDHERRLTNAIDDAIENIRGKLTTDDLRASISDLVRLIQLRKELSDEAPKQVTVRWIEEWKNSPANEE